MSPSDKNIRNLFYYLAFFNSIVLAILGYLSAQAEPQKFAILVGSLILIVAWSWALRTNSFSVSIEVLCVGGLALVGLSGIPPTDTVSLIGAALIFRGVFAGGGLRRKADLEGFPILSIVLYLTALLGGKVILHDGYHRLLANLVVLVPLGISGVVLGRTLARSDSAWERSLVRERFLNQAMRNFTDQLDLEAIQLDAVHSAMQLIGTDQDTRITLFAVKGDDLVMCAAEGRESLDARHWTPITITDPIRTALAKDKSSLFEPKASEEIATHENKHISPYFLIFPLRAESHVLGALVAGFTNSPKEEITEALEVLAGETSAAWHNSLLANEIAFRAQHDSLTGLINRGTFLDQVENLIEKRNDYVLTSPNLPNLSKDAASISAVLFIDLDGFKEINDEHGHAFGDAVLIAIAHRLQIDVRNKDLLSRFGGDEFAIFIESEANLDSSLQVAQRVATLIASPISIEGKTVTCASSIGISVFDKTKSVNQLIREADTAMYAAKRQESNSITVYDPALDRELLEQSTLKLDLGTAVINNQISLHYQPVLALRTSGLTSFEALARWRHPLKGEIPPDVFIPIAEDTGLIVPLGRRLLQQACLQLNQWRHELSGLENVKIAVNVSLRELDESDYVSAVMESIELAQLSANDLILEVTESLLMAENHPAVSQLRDLHDMGVLISVDDFGTGYSSLSRLSTFPIDFLKIDRSFVQALSDGPLMKVDATAAIVIRAILAMAQGLDMKVIAEGVEQPSQAKWLTDVGCGEAQGYLFSRPQPPAILKDWLTTYAGLESRY